MADKYTETKVECPPLACPLKIGKGSVFTKTAGDTLLYTSTHKTSSDLP